MSAILEMMEIKKGEETSPQVIQSNCGSAPEKAKSKAAAESLRADD